MSAWLWFPQSCVYLFFLLLLLSWRVPVSLQQQGEGGGWQLGELDDSTFQSSVEEAEFAVVAFHAPWLAVTSTCGCEHVLLSGLGRGLSLCLLSPLFFRVVIIFRA